MAEVSTAEAATMLGVTDQQVRDLMYAGALRGRRLDSNRWLVDTSSVHAYEAVRGGRGRRWSTESAWAVLDCLDGVKLAGRTPASTATLKQRARARIRQHTAEQIGQKVAHRVSAHRYNSEDRAAVAAELGLTGRSAAAAVTDLTPQTRLVEGYLRAGELEDFAARHLLLRDDVNGDVIIYTGAEYRYLNREPGRAVIAADLIRSTDIREHSAGVTLLERLRSEWLATPTQ